jgi:enoyl-CoA hydratase/carnithine racemase
VSMIEFSSEGPVAVIKLNRPPVNALSEEFAAEILAAVNRCESAEYRAVMIYGDPHFAAGADIKGFQAKLDAADPTDGPSPAGVLITAIAKMELLEKPVIAAIKGFALGGGFELAMGADFRYAAEGARMGQPEILLGLIPGAGGTQRLARLIGTQKARLLTYTGMQVDAVRAMELGMVDRVFPDDELFDRTMESCQKMAKRPTLAIAAAKRALNEGFGLTIEEGLKIEDAGFQKVFISKDAAEGVDAFINKREATFTGE